VADHVPIRRDNADERRAPDLECADRFAHGVGILEVALQRRLGEQTLIENAHGTGGGPGDGLDGHVTQTNCGLRIAD
jgi:hypothetical protein